MGYLPCTPQTAAALEQLLGKSQLLFSALERKGGFLGDDSMEQKELKNTIRNFRKLYCQVEQNWAYVLQALLIWV